MRDGRPERGDRGPRTLLAIIAVAGSAALVVASLIFLPRAIVIFDLQGRAVGTPDLLKATNDSRAAVLQAIGGFAILLGAYATLRRLRVSEDELRATRDGQVTERFGRSIEHLGSDKVDVRVGAVYGLERIARNSQSDRDAIVSTLSAFIRAHSPRTSGADSSRSTLALKAADVQAAIIALGRLPRVGIQERIRIPNTDLQRSRLWQLNLDGALIGGADLRGARLWEASLVGADLGDADLRDVDLARAKLQGAWMVAADLRGANLDEADLVGALSDGQTRWPGELAALDASGLGR
jgi:Pentapeptide repeats (8 copies)